MKAIKFLFSVLCALAVMQAVLGEAQHVVRIAPSNPPAVRQSPVLPPVVPSAGPWSIPGQPALPGLIPGLTPGLIPSQPFPGSSGIVQPFVTSPVQPFVNAPVQAFVTSSVQPIFPYGPYGIAVPTQPAAQTLKQNRHGRQRVVAGAIQRVVPVQPPHLHLATPLQVSVPPPGTARAEVIRRLGYPSGSVLTRDGEMLYYGSGITVFIQNGQVAHPERYR